MDEVVLRAMARWPNVPAVYGWLSLDRRGQWRLKDEVIAHEGSVQFIGRNYQRGPDGSWYFQNGPQRVYVRLDYTPWVLFLTPGADGLTTHTGQEVEASGFWLDDAGSLLIDTPLGVGLLYDQDLSDALDRMQVASGDEDELELALDNPWRGEALGLCLAWQGESWPVLHVPASEVPSRFEFQPEPLAPSANATDDVPEPGGT